MIRSKTQTDETASAPKLLNLKGIAREADHEADADHHAVDLEATDVAAHAARFLADITDAVLDQTTAGPPPTHVRVSTPGATLLKKPA